MKNLVIKETSRLPSVHVNGTHYVATIRLTLELMEAIGEAYRDIVKVSGNYTWGINRR